MKIFIYKLPHYFIDNYRFCSPAGTKKYKGNSLVGIDSAGFLAVRPQIRKQFGHFSTNNSSLRDFPGKGSRITITVLSMPTKQEPLPRGTAFWF